MINVRRVALSRRLSQLISVERSSFSWVDGEFVPGEPATITIRGIITIAQSKDADMRPEADFISGSVRLITTEQVYLTGGSHFSDVVVWRGGRYKVISVTPDIDYGFFRATLTRMEGEDDGIG